MQIVENIKMALNSIWTNKIRSFLTTLGIMIGVASVILLVSIGSGLQNFVTKEFESLGSNILFISPGRINFGGGPPTNAEAKFDFEDIRRIGNLGLPITKASGMITRGATLKYRNESYYGSIAGVNEEYLDYGNIELAEGEFFNKSAVERSQDVVVLGHKVYTELFGEGRQALGREIDIAGSKVKVIGRFKEKSGGFGGSGDDNSYVFIPVTTASKITGIKKPAAVMVRTVTAEDTPVATRKIEQYFKNLGLTEDDYTIMEPKQLLETINSFLGVVTGALSGIAAISLVVGGIGIANIMLVSVTERTREIGLRKAVGATPNAILMQFLIESIILSLVGGTVGILIGSAGSLALRAFINTAITPWSIILAFGFSAVVGIIFGVAPAIRASRLDPIEALRYE